MNEPTSKGPRVLRVLTGLVIWQDGTTGRAVLLSDGTMETEGWDFRSKFWVREAFDLKSLANAHDSASPEVLAAVIAD